MFALVLIICYLHGGCEDNVIAIFHTRQECQASMAEQRIRHGGCYPVEHFIDNFWNPAHEYGDF